MIPRNESDVENSLAMSRKHYSMLLVTPESEPDATGNSWNDEHRAINALSEPSVALVKVAKVKIVLPQTRKRIV